MHLTNLRLVSVRSQLPDVCILIDRPNKGQQVFGKRCRSFFAKDAFRQRKRREKRFREFSAGNRFFVDPVAIQVGLSPHWPVFSGVFPFKIGDGVSEFVDKRI